MIRYINARDSRLVLIGSFFIVFFLYFGIFNRYHILYLEQNQLFLYNFSFLKENFSLPGGLALYLGNFFTQFFISSWAGTFIITLNAFAVFVLSDCIFKKHNLNNLISAFIPVSLLAVLQSNELFTFGQSIGILTLLLFFALYISIDKSLPRYLIYFIGWPVFYIISGCYSIPAVLFCVIHELFFRKQDYNKLIVVLFIITGLVVPYLFASIIFYIPISKIFTYPVPLELNSYSLYALVLLIAWIPLVLLFSSLLNKISPVKSKPITGSIPNMLAGTLIFILMGFSVYRYGYNKKTELMLGIDYYVQHEEWNTVLKLSEQFPDLNRLVVYYTNLALYKTGNLLEKMFMYPQTGTSGLMLKRERSSSFFFGGEVFYYLSYISEANRWAFESMIAGGLNPRALKRLVTTCIINGDSEIARKYLYLLNQTLFYRKFTKKYVNYLRNPELADKDPDISRNRNLMIHSDFVSNENDLNLLELLKNHPENKMAYEYLIASLLLDKRLDAFAIYILSIKDYGYTKMPTHIEEALILYNSYEKKNILPAGFSFRPETVSRFKDFIARCNSNKDNTELAAEELKKTYGNTYWYYLQFINKK